MLRHFHRPCAGGEAVTRLLTERHALDQRVCRVVELKFFAGLNIDETAQAL